MQVGEALLVLLHDGQKGAHVPDLMVDVVPPGFGRSFGGSAREHGHCGQRRREDRILLLQLFKQPVCSHPLPCVRTIKKRLKR